VFFSEHSVVNSTQRLEVMSALPVTTTRLLQWWTKWIVQTKLGHQTDAETIWKHPLLSYQYALPQIQRVQI